MGVDSSQAQEPSLSMTGEFKHLKCGDLAAKSFGNSYLYHRDGVPIFQVILPVLWTTSILSYHRKNIATYEPYLIGS